MSCCYLPETWAVIFGWVELSAPRSVDFGGKGWPIGNKILSKNTFGRHSSY